MRAPAIATALSRRAAALHIRTQLMLLTAVFGLLGMAGLLVYLGEEWREARDEAQQAAEATAQQVADELDARLREHIEMLERIAQRPRVRAMDPAACDTAVHQLPQLMPEILSVGVRRLDSALVCASLANAPALLEPAEALPLRNAVERGRPYVGGALLSAATGRWVVVVAVPLRNAAGAIDGAVLAPLDVVRYSARVFDRLPGGIVVSVHDAQHRVLLRSHNADTLAGQVLPEEMRALAEPGHHAQGVDLLGVPEMARLAPMHHGNWMVIAGVLHTPVDGPLRTRLVFGSAGVAAGLLLLLLLARWISRRVSAPLQRLADTAERIAAGETALRAPADGSRELAAFAAAFNRMLDRLAEANARHAVLEQHLDTLVRHSSRAVLLLDAQLHIVDASEAAVAAYGHSREALLGMDMARLRQGGEAGLQRWRELLAAGDDALLEEVHLDRDGQPVEVEVSAHCFTVDGQPFLQAFVRSLAGRREAERQLRMLSLALDQGQLGVMVSDAQGVIQYVNPAFAHGKGYGPRELVGQPVSRVRGPDALAAREPVWNEPLNTMAWQGELPRLRKDGSRYTAHVVVSALRDAHGKDTGWELETEDSSGNAERVRALDRRCRELSEELGRVLRGEAPQG